MKILVLVISCRAYRATRQRALMETWASEPPEGVEILVTEGGHPEDRRSGPRLELSVPDGYDDLAGKTWRALRYCREALDWDGVLKCDDDSFVHLERLRAAAAALGDYQGCPVAGVDGAAPYAQGGAYWLSRKAVEQLARGSFSDHASRLWFKGNSRMRKLGERRYRRTTSIEDMMVGDLMAASGIPLTPDDRFAPKPFPSVFEDPRLISTHYVRPRMMRWMCVQRRWLRHSFLRYPARCFRWLPGARAPR